MLDDLSGFVGERVIVAEKYDGANTTMYADHFHARSMDANPHPSQSWAKGFWSEHVRFQVPEGWRLNGKNLYAVHSIAYDDLDSYFVGFSIWCKTNQALCWDDTMEWFGPLGVTAATVLFEGPWEEFTTRYTEFTPTPGREGYVVRVARSFHAREFMKVVAKFVRANHVTQHQHWRVGAAVIPQGARWSIPAVGSLGEVTRWKRTWFSQLVGGRDPLTNPSLVRQTRVLSLPSSMERVGQHDELGHVMTRRKPEDFPMTTAYRYEGTIEFAFEVEDMGDCKRRNFRLDSNLIAFEELLEFQDDEDLNERLDELSAEVEQLADEIF